MRPGLLILVSSLEAVLLLAASSADFVDASGSQASCADVAAELLPEQGTVLLQRTKQHQQQQRTKQAVSQPLLALLENVEDSGQSTNGSTRLCRSYSDLLKVENKEWPTQVAQVEEVGSAPAQEIFGDKVPLDAGGFKAVMDADCGFEKELFVGRVVKELGLKVKNNTALHDWMPAGVYSVKPLTFEDLKTIVAKAAEDRSNIWLTHSRASVAVGDENTIPDAKPQVKEALVAVGDKNAPPDAKPLVQEAIQDAIAVSVEPSLASLANSLPPLQLLGVPEGRKKEEKGKKGRDERDEVEPREDEIPDAEAHEDEDPIPHEDEIPDAIPHDDEIPDSNLIEDQTADAKPNVKAPLMHKFPTLLKALGLVRLPHSHPGLALMTVSGETKAAPTKKKKKKAKVIAAAVVEANDETNEDNEDGVVYLDNEDGDEEIDNTDKEKAGSTKPNLLQKQKKGKDKQTMSSREEEERNAVDEDGNLEEEEQKKGKDKQTMSSREEEERNAVDEDGNLEEEEQVNSRVKNKQKQGSKKRRRIPDSMMHLNKNEKSRVLKKGKQEDSGEQAEDGLNSAGQTSSLDQKGYAAVSKLKSLSNMEAFIKRAIDDRGLTVVDEGALKGVVPYYSGAKATQSWKALSKELDKAEKLKGKKSWLQPPKGDEENARNSDVDEEYEDDAPDEDDDNSDQPRKGKGKHTNSLAQRRTHEQSYVPLYVPYSEGNGKHTNSLAQKQNNMAQQQEPAPTHGFGMMVAKTFGPQPDEETHKRPARASLASDSPATSLEAAAAAAAGEDGFSEGQAAELVGLVSRPELEGSLVTLHFFDAAVSRWAVSLETGESIRVRANNLRHSNLKPKALKPKALAAGAPGKKRKKLHV